MLMLMLVRGVDWLGNWGGAHGFFSLFFVFFFFLNEGEEPPVELPLESDESYISLY